MDQLGALAEALLLSRAHRGEFGFRSLQAAISAGSNST
jgi:hypothetical protein